MDSSSKTCNCVRDSRLLTWAGSLSALGLSLALSMIGMWSCLYTSRNLNHSQSSKIINNKLLIMIQYLLGTSRSALTCLIHAAVTFKGVPEFCEKYWSTIEMSALTEKQTSVNITPFEPTNDTVHLLSLIILLNLLVVCGVEIEFKELLRKSRFHEGVK